MSSSENITTATLRQLKSVRPIAVLTAYDFITAGLADQAGADLILVGDSLTMTALGHPTTLPATVDIMLHHTAAVARAHPRALVVADIPFAEAHQGISHIVKVGAQFLRAGASAIKIEGGQNMTEEIRALVSAGIPVLGHIGLLPQQIMNLGRYRKFGVSQEEKESILADGLAVQQAGAFAVVVEMVHPQTTAELTAQLAIPTIGIGSGPSCDGQVLVITDILGLTPTPPPSFAPVRIQGRELFTEALRGFVQDVQQKRFPKL
jgi:3-methyl-2-oxobutanoate hydroxymethyltransferase